MACQLLAPSRRPRRLANFRKLGLCRAARSSHQFDAANHQPQPRSALLAHHPKVVLGVLIEVFRLDGLASARRVLGEIGVTLVIVARVAQGIARIAGMVKALRTWSRRQLLAWLALRPERSSRTLVQDCFGVSCWNGLA